MEALNLPAYNFSIKEVNGKRMILDKIRKKYVSLTPEEWVRQNFISFLVEEKKYPASLMAIETKVLINGLPQRADIVIYNTQRQPLLIVECKAPSVKITSQTFDQAARYNIILKTKIICLTNGLNHYCALLDNSGINYNFLQDIPEYAKVKGN